MRQKKWDQPLRFSREAAREYSPGREPGVRSGTEFSPEGAAEKLRYKLRRDVRSFVTASAAGAFLFSLSNTHKREILTHRSWYADKHRNR